MDDYLVRIVRKAKSYQYKSNPRLPDSWDVGRNDQNNMLDDFIFFVGEARMLWVKCQSIANMPGARIQDSLAPGPFKLKLFVGEGPNADPRLFYGRIHGIIDAFDLEGQWINGKSIQPVAGKDGAPIDVARTLVHDTQKHKPSPPNVETRVAWSAGCVIMTPPNLAVFGVLLDDYKLRPGDVIPGELVEEG